MFRTSIKIPKSQENLKLHDTVVSMGSCFADSMGKRLANNKINTLVNPFGIIYNPLSVFKLISQSLDQQNSDPDGFLIRDGQHYHFDLHSSFTDTSRENLAMKVKQIQDQTHRQLSKANWLLLTFGTAFVFERVDNHEVVANCHKVPSSSFEKRLLSAKEIMTAFDTFYQRLKEVNPAIQIMVTVSPIRHIKEGLSMNSVSKSTLRLAAHYMSSTYHQVVYFPGYEIMLDDLRDYRFYDEDMIHPSKVALDYIWETLISHFADDDLKAFVRNWEEIRKSLDHKPFNVNAESHQRFLKKLLAKLHLISDQVDVREEINQVESQLKP